MKYTITILATLLFSTLVSAEVCDISQDPKDADPEDTPLTDSYFSSGEALSIINRLSKTVQTEPTRFDINDVTILKGHILLNKIKYLELEAIKYKSQGFNAEGIVSEIKSAKEEYCSFREASRRYDE